MGLFDKKKKEVQEPVVEQEPMTDAPESKGLFNEGSLARTGNQLNLEVYNDADTNQILMLSDSNAKINTESIKKARAIFFKNYFSEPKTYHEAVNTKLRLLKTAKLSVVEKEEEVGRLMALDLWKSGQLNIYEFVGFYQNLAGLTSNEYKQYFIIFINMHKAYQIIGAEDQDILEAYSRAILTMATRKFNSTLDRYYMEMQKQLDLLSAIYNFVDNHWDFFTAVSTGKTIIQGNDVSSYNVIDVTEDDNYETDSSEYGDDSEVYGYEEVSSMVQDDESDVDLSEEESYRDYTDPEAEEPVAPSNMGETVADTKPITVFGGVVPADEPATAEEDFGSLSLGDEVESEAEVETADETAVETEDEEDFSSLSLGEESEAEEESVAEVEDDFSSLSLEDETEDSEYAETEDSEYAEIEDAGLTTGEEAQMALEDESAFEDSEVAEPIGEAEPEEVEVAEPEEEVEETGDVNLVDIQDGLEPVEEVAEVEEEPADEVAEIEEEPADEVAEIEEESAEETTEEAKTEFKPELKDVDIKIPTPTLTKASQEVDTFLGGVVDNKELDRIIANGNANAADAEDDVRYEQSTEDFDITPLEVVLKTTEGMRYKFQSEHFQLILSALLRLNELQNGSRTLTLTLGNLDYNQFALSKANWDEFIACITADTFELDGVNFAPILNFLYDRIKYCGPNRTYVVIYDWAVDRFNIGKILPKLDSELGAKQSKVVFLSLGTSKTITSELFQNAQYENISDLAISFEDAQDPLKLPEILRQAVTG